MSPVIYFILLVAVSECRPATAVQRSAAAGNRFGTKNSYHASLELWEDAPTEFEGEHSCCQPIQVTSVY